MRRTTAGIRVLLALAVPFASLLASCRPNDQAERDALALWLEYQPACSDALEAGTDGGASPRRIALLALHGEALTAIEERLGEAGAGGEGARESARLLADLAAASRRLCEYARPERPIPALASTIVAERVLIADLRSRLALLLPLGTEERQARAAKYAVRLSEAVSRELEKEVAAVSPPNRAGSGAARPGSGEHNAARPGSARASSARLHFAAPGSGRDFTRAGSAQPSSTEAGSTRKTASPHEAPRVTTASPRHAGIDSLPVASPTAPRRPGDTSTAVRSSLAAAVSIRSASGESWQALNQRRRVQGTELLQRWLPLYRESGHRLLAARSALSRGMRHDSLDGLSETCAALGQAVAATPPSLTASAPGDLPGTAPGWTVRRRLERALAGWRAAARSCVEGDSTAAYFRLIRADEDWNEAAEQVRRLERRTVIPPPAASASAGR